MYINQEALRLYNSYDLSHASKVINKTLDGIEKGKEARDLYLCSISRGGSCYCCLFYSHPCIYHRYKGLQEKGTLKKLRIVLINLKKRVEGELEKR